MLTGPAACGASIMARHPKSFTGSDILASTRRRNLRSPGHERSIRLIPHRLLPIHAPLAHQKRQARGGERLRDRADQELCIGCHLQAGFDIAKAVGPDERRLPVLLHRDGEAGNLSLVHRFRDEKLERGNEGRNGFAAHKRLGCHRTEPSTGAITAKALKTSRCFPRATAAAAGAAATSA